ncbi:C-factor [Elysia marginata]|uniref:C-factor n=1 Tax=Elysia marginata TaxID=1093978 RepID=A0AAV4GC07_9GAST|nr:C-factor [Elysia marginata]
MSIAVRAAMVTGASRGIGLEFVRQMVALPSPPEVLVAACRDPSSATDLQNLTKSNPNLKIVKLDVEKDEDIEEAFKETQALLGEKGLNILINNAGHYDKSDAGELRQINRQIMQKHFNINVTGQLMVIQKFLPLLELAVAERGSKQLNCQAQVILMASMLSSQTLTYREGKRTCLHYKCSKTAATLAGIMLSRELLRDAGIHVLLLHPGSVRTDMGGPKATISPQESINGCLNIIAASSEATTGKFLQYSGEELPY